MPTPDEIFSVIAISLRELPEPDDIEVVKENGGNSIVGARRLDIDKDTADLLKATKGYRARCNALANKFGCLFLESMDGGFCFAKLGKLLDGGRPSRKKSGKSIGLKKAESTTKRRTKIISEAVAKGPENALELRPTVTNVALWSPDRPPKQDWEKLRGIVLERDNCTCGFCGHSARKWMNVHHLGSGSNNDPANLVTACVACHAVLHTGRSLALGVIEIWKSEWTQIQIVQYTRDEIRKGRTLSQIKADLPLKPTALPPSSEDHANRVLRTIANRQAASLPKPLCAVFIELKRWQIE